MSIYKWATEISDALQQSTSLSGVYVWDELIWPTSSWKYSSVLYSSSSGTITHYWGDSYWEIKLTDWTTTITIADRNVWATTYYTYGAGLSQANCGCYFQWWNNYGFPFTGSASTISTSSTQVDASSYGPGNYYKRRIFIKQVGSWDSSNNDNLRWDTTNTDEARQWPCDSWYHVPTVTELQNLWTLVQSITQATTWAQLRDYCLFPFVGSRSWYDAAIYGNGDWGYYWTSSPRDSYASYVYLDSTSVNTNTRNRRANGVCIRPFKNS